MVQEPSYWKVLTRRKILPTEGNETETKLNRVLGLYDLTALGVGSTLGAGVYVLAGQIAKEQAGPSVVLSFAIAALASLLAGVCYAEFGARVPKAGSAYVYSYVCIGEFAAFVIGWNLILEYVIGTAAVCRGISLYLDTLINDTLKTTFAEITPIEVSFLGSYFDLFAFGLVIVFGVALAFGVETSTIANNFCTCLNISILIFVIIAGSVKANFSNWAIDVSIVNATTNADDLNTNDLGSGGFFPFGFTGTLRGAATCFFGFVGFDCIATTGEEVRNPRKNIPRSILLSLLIIFLCYFGVSMVLTLMIPYYRQDPNAPLPYAFKEVGWNFAMWIVSIGGLIGLLASLFGALFPLPRILYSMAEDGLLFHFLGKVSPRFQVPVHGSIFAAIMTALIAGLFDLAQLVSLLSIGTLLAYSVVAISITILRYMDNSSYSEKLLNSNTEISETTTLKTSENKITLKTILLQLFNCKRLKTPNMVSTRIVGSFITIFCLLSLGIGLILMQGFDALILKEIWALVLIGVFIGLTILVLLIICLQPREIFTPLISVFRVPFVPIVPAISMFINIYLMLQLDVMTWIRFGIWMVIGIPMYIACYCLHDSKTAEKCNPNRIEFRRVLKSSGFYIGNDDRANGLMPNKLEVAQDISKTKANGKLDIIAAQNQLSLKSLDEIVNINEMGKELIEMRHRNGKVFYIEDTRSNTSTTTLLEREEMKKVNTTTENFSSTAEEEKSVMALLDNVLKGEDDESILPTPLHDLNSYNRKYSVDSEMLPSVIETTIVATVHSSSDSSEHDLDDVPEDNEEQVIVTSSEFALLSPSFDHIEHRQKCEILAQKLVDEVLASEALQEALLKFLEKKFENFEENQIQISGKEMSSVDNDPMHSEFFKNKLSQLILKTQNISNNRAKISKADEKLESENKEETQIVFRTNLKHSKSEADVVFKTIEHLDKLNNNVDKGRSNFNSIPKPPKFDPLLYNTINSLNTNRVRPSLDKLIKDDDIKNSRAILNLNGIDSDFTSFKKKLENILIRGPSHRTQHRPDITVRNPLTSRAEAVIETSTSKELENRTENTKNQNKFNTSNWNSTTAISAEELIFNARKTLRPVKNGAIIS